MAAQLAGQSLRFGWYFALQPRWSTGARASSAARAPKYRPTRPVPSTQELLADQAQLLMAMRWRCAMGSIRRWRTRQPRRSGISFACGACWPTCPMRSSRRASNDARTAKAEAIAADVPDYYAQDFHFQTGGYLTDDSARLYDVQVETLFMGAAGPMRAHALRADRRVHARARPAPGHAARCRLRHGAVPAPGAARVSGHDAEGPRPVAGLSRRGAPPSRGLRGAELIAAPAERMPLADASVDIVTRDLPLHELPPEVRRQVTAEIARVLKPGGLFVFLDSLQMGDRPGWDGLLEAFPHRFHEPYFRHYAIDDLDGMFTAAGLALQRDVDAVPVEADGAGQGVRARLAHAWWGWKRCSKEDSIGGWSRSATNEVPSQKEGQSSQGFLACQERGPL